MLFKRKKYEISCVLSIETFFSICIIFTLTDAKRVIVPRKLIEHTNVLTIPLIICAIIIIQNVQLMAVIIVLQKPNNFARIFVV